MNNGEPQTTFEMLLLVAGHLRGLDLDTFHAWVPFMQEARWLSAGLRQGSSEGIDMELVEALVLSLAGQLEGTGSATPGRVLVFLLADWERMELGSIERILGLLGNRLPGARIEAMLLSSGEGRVLDLVLVAG